MLPIGDDDSISPMRAYVNLILIAINVLVFLWEITGNTDQIIMNYGLIPAEILRGQHLYTFLTSMFMHGGWMHILGNMLFLWIFGDNVEEVLGHVGYFVFYMLGGFAASIAHILFNANSTIPSVGASGAIAAVLGAYIVMFPRARVRVLYFLGFYGGVARVTALLFLGIWFVTQLFTGIGSLGVPTAQTSGVAVWAHVGGFVFGLVVGLLFRGRAQSSAPIRR